MRYNKEKNGSKTSNSYQGTQKTEEFDPMEDNDLRAMYPSLFTITTKTLSNY